VRSDGRYEIGEVAPALEALRQGTQLEARRVSLRPINPDAPCALRHLGPCSGPMQRAHLFSRKTHNHHPLLHHADNTPALCRRHHRRFHCAYDGHDFVVNAARGSIPAGGYGRLTVAYLEFVMTRVAPRDQRAALRVGTMLEQRCAQRAVTPEGAVEVSLYHGWLYGCGLERPAALRPAVYTFDERDYVRPGANGEPGECRTYRVNAEVITALREPRGLEVGDSDLRAVMAAWLEAHGEARSEIRDRLRTQRDTKPSPATLCRWIARGKKWLEAAHSAGRGDAARGAAGAMNECSAGTARGSSVARAAAAGSRGEAHTQPEQMKPRQSSSGAVLNGAGAAARVSPPQALGLEAAGGDPCTLELIVGSDGLPRLSERSARRLQAVGSVLSPPEGSKRAGQATGWFQVRLASEDEQWQRPLFDDP
jgi:hypothetical protein